MSSDWPTLFLCIWKAFSVFFFFFNRAHVRSEHLQKHIWLTHVCAYTCRKVFVFNSRTRAPLICNRSLAGLSASPQSGSKQEKQLDCFSSPLPTLISSPSLLHPSCPKEEVKRLILNHQSHWWIQVRVSASLHHQDLCCTLLGRSICSIIGV